MSRLSAGTLTPMQLEALGPDTTDEELLEIAKELSERGDIRGELIRLQTNSERSRPTAKDVKRMKAILRDDIDALLGVLEPVLRRKPLSFRKGFVDVAEVRDLHPKHAGEITEAFRTPWVRRISKLRAPTRVLLEPSLVNLRHASVFGATDALAITEAKRALPWKSFRTHLESREDARILADVSLFPALETLQLGEGIDADPDETQALALPRRATKFSQEFLHPSHVGSWLARASVVERSTTHLRACFEPRYAPSDSPPFVVDLSLVRDDAAAPWATLDVTAVFIVKLVHMRSTAMKWLEAAIESARSLPVECVRLGVSADKPAAQRTALEAILAQTFGDRFER